MKIFMTILRAFVYMSVVALLVLFIIIGFVKPIMLEHAVNYLIYHTPGLTMLVLMLLLNIVSIFITAYVTEKKERKEFIKYMDVTTALIITEKDNEIKALKKQLREYEKEAVKIMETNNNLRKVVREVHNTIERTYTIGNVD